MLDTTIKLRKYFERMEEKDFSSSNELYFNTLEDWANAIILSNILKRFGDTPSWMSKTSYITSNAYFEGIAFLYKYWKGMMDNYDPKLKAMGTKMKKKLDKYYGSLKVNTMVLIPVASDPSKTLNYVRYCHSQNYDNSEKSDVMHGNEEKAFERLYKFYQHFSPASGSQNLGVQKMSASGSSSNADDEGGNIGD